MGPPSHYTMQTFLPYASFEESARVLDDRRLGKQRVECLQLLQVLLGRKLDTVLGTIRFHPKGWVNHPAAKMWHGYEDGLAKYMESICMEWQKRGFKDSCLFKLQSLFPFYHDAKLPQWVGSEAVHASHRSNLLRKEPGWYGRFGWSEPHDLPYIWPAVT